MDSRLKLGLAVVAVVAVVVLAIVWSSPAGIDRSNIEQQLRASSWFVDYSTTRLVLYRNLVSPPSDLLREHPEIATFAAAGLVEVRPNAVLFDNPVGSRVVLTAAGESAAAGWKRTTGVAAEEAWLVPTATKQIDTISNIFVAGETAECSVTWKWLPNEIGVALGVESRPRTSQARFRRVERAWVLQDLVAN